MYDKLYKVKGTDVNGFMIMQNVAYVTYATKLMEVFLTEKGYSTNRLSKLKIGLQKKSEQVFSVKPLMFNQVFRVVLSVDNLENSDELLSVSVHFYNEKDELCTRVHTDFYWFDYQNWKPIEAPKRIVNTL